MRGAEVCGRMFSKKYVRPLVSDTTLTSLEGGADVFFAYLYIEIGIRPHLIGG